MIVASLASVAPAVPVGPLVAEPPVLVASVSVMADPSQVATGADAGQVTGGFSSVKTPKLLHVYVEVAAVPPTVGAWVQVKMIVNPLASVAPVAAGGVPLAVPPVLAASSSVMEVPSQVGAAAAAGQLTAVPSLVNKPEDASHVHVLVAAAAPAPAP